jgi:cytochrome c-type biogenesis protein CcmH
MASRSSIGAVLIVFFAMAAGAVGAVEPDEILADPTLEVRARMLSAELRCLVCQNQSIDDSNAPLARDLRLLVRERLAAGDGDEMIRTYILDRYGTFVLLKPPFDRRTMLLWLAPVVLVLAAAAISLAKIRRMRTLNAALAPDITAEEEIRLRALLAQETETEEPLRGPNLTKI